MADLYKEYGLFIALLGCAEVDDLLPAPFEITRGHMATVGDGGYLLDQTL